MGKGLRVLRVSGDNNSYIMRSPRGSGQKAIIKEESVKELLEEKGSEERLDLGLGIKGAH